MDVYWLEQTQEDLPAEDFWLSAAEIARMNSMRFPKRRADWRLGRWTAKRAFAAYLDIPAHTRLLLDTEIRPNASGAPELFFANELAEVSISITHCGGRAACAIAGSDVVLGCDMETIEPRSDRFIADYFTREERAFIAQTPAADGPRVVALLWSAKESALKALQEGLRLDTRSVAVTLVDPGIHGEDGWYPLHVRAQSGELFRGWHQCNGHEFVRTMVAVPRPAPPILLKIHELAHHA